MSSLKRPQPAKTRFIDGWALTETISPRRRVRVADVDAYGQIINEYTSTAPISGEQPATPWAIYLAGTDKQYRLICFDLDASKGNPTYDAGKLTMWLRDLAIPYLVTQSGPSGGRHVWIGLSAPVAAPTIHAIARLAKQELRSLDLSPLGSPTHGCVRPPGAPHRDGGESFIIEGDVGVLTFPTVDGTDVDALMQYLIELTGGFREPRQPVRAKNVDLDSQGHPYLSFGTRKLSQTSRNVVINGRPGTDASAVLASALTRCAHAGMRLSDVLAIAPTSPAFTHAYTARAGAASRRPRQDRQTQALMERQWAKAVEWVATSPKAFTGDDPTFDDRAAHVTNLVEQLQTRADASPGRWSRSGAGPMQSAGTGRYTDRLALDGVCLLALRAVSATVEVSDRTLALLVGVGRETARTALLRLQEDGWILRAAVSDGPHASKWQLRELSTDGAVWNRSQVSPPPALPAPAFRNLWITALTRKITATTHDVFAAPGGLGRTAGRLFAQLESSHLQSLGDLSSRVGIPPQLTKRYLQRLEHCGLAFSAGLYWQSSPTDARTAVADSLGVNGYLDERKHRYAIERQAWAWWQAELQRRHEPRRRRRQWHAGQPRAFTLVGQALEYPIHPRKKDGRSDFAAARLAIANGILTGADITESVAA